MSTIFGIVMSLGLICFGGAIQIRYVQANPVVGLILMAFGVLCFMGTLIEAFEDREIEIQALPAKNRKRLGPSDPG